MYNYYLQKMSKPKLDAYIKKMEDLLKEEKDEHNRSIFKLWLLDAEEERDTRDTKRAIYLNRYYTQNK